MRNDLTPFRTVRELLVNSDCVLMGNAVNTNGNLSDAGQLQQNADGAG
jgi:hypothetical protein